MKDTRTTQRIAGAILAGGKAQRMGGIPKGMLGVPTAEGDPHRDESRGGTQFGVGGPFSAGGSLSLIERLVMHLMRAGVQEIIIVANEGHPYTRIGCAIVPDGRIEAGPLAGIEAALGYFAGRYDAVLCLPCDMPSLSWKEVSALMAALADTGGPVVFAETEDGARHPLCAVVRVDLRDGISAALDHAQFAVGDVWSQLGGFALRFDNPNAFVNLNSPGDVDAWLAGRPDGKAR
ncbi:MAG: molybdenum cofactor guanylyltransferase [Planctomycetes bacterium]|nr:molybdenum cofactor guanylyltransferase [Planctomycetota bacterium]